MPYPKLMMPNLNQWKVEQLIEKKEADSLNMPYLKLMMSNSNQVES
ncbi:17194_t:CDS:2 [Dentiscutata erythropus]|uniref:17194_t:CDS:1 n=1 Tax=Dentiscutata erythropus TaxID=1348616 RepID=A0A9N9F5X8_9GLOM|nr:17194_t:CDS:2 [Dentiscutata erythropus]